MARCSRCGFINRDDAKACVKCGQPIITGLIDTIGIGRKIRIAGPAISVGPTTYGDGISYVTSGDFIQQIKTINVKALTGTQIETFTSQLNLLMNQMGIGTTLDKEAKIELAEGDKRVVELIGAKVKEIEEHTGKLVENPETYLRLGNVEYSYGNLKNALEFYDKAIRLKSDYGEAWLNKGSVLDDLERYNEAIEAYNKALSILPKNEMGWYNKGVIYLHLKSYQDAINSFDEATNINSKYEKAWNNKGIAYHYIEKYDDAIKCYDKVLEIKPNDEVYVNKGVALKKLGRFAEAIRSYDSAMKLNPDRKEALYNKANLLHEMKKYDDALTCYEQL
ncbi:MAG: tetratricopeptide repeat protein, partial [Candidatus Thermoplasmatota archaeon]